MSRPPIVDIENEAEAACAGVVVFIAVFGFAGVVAVFTRINRAIAALGFRFRAVAARSRVSKGCSCVWRCR